MAAVDHPPVPLLVRLFGPFEVRVNGAPLPSLRSRKGQWLLALLALRAGQPVERTWLTGTLWPDSPQSQGLASLRTTLADLRRALGPAATRLGAPTPRTLHLELDGAEVDVLAFDAAMARGDTSSLEDALGLYRGPLLEGCSEEWVFQERQGREQAYLSALESLAAHAWEQGDPPAAEQHLRQVIAVDPLRESAQRGLMQLLAADGNYAAALQVYRELRERLHRELNAAPDPETVTLYERARQQARGKAVQGSGFRVQSSKPVSPEQAMPAGTVTFLFTDIEGSTRLLERYPEAMAAALARHDDLLRGVIEGHGGTVFKTVGDQFCAAFPTAVEATAAALAAQRAVQQQDWQGVGPLRVRMALHTGEPEATEEDYAGLPLHRVAHLVAAAHGGQVLLSAAPAELVRETLPEAVSLRDLGEHRLKEPAEPERIFQLVAPELPSDFPPLRSLTARPGNLPASLAPLIGRQQEVQTLRELLRRGGVRLLTLTGPGGCGKTRLAVQAAAEQRGDFQHGAFLVDLAPIRDPELMLSTIAHTLGVRETGDQPLPERLKAYLREKHLLLVLDNFEHILPAAPQVVDLLQSAPRLKALVTSRAPLRLQGEQEFPVPPLLVPDPAHLPPFAALAGFAAVELFCQRAAQVQPGFCLTVENAPAVAAICHRLDGLPLALELAAARVKLLPPVALLARLVGAGFVPAPDGRPSTLPSGGTRSPLQLLTGGRRDQPARQQTLRDTIAWSYELLSEEEQALFRRLSVFVGGCTLEAAEAVCAGEGDPELSVLEGVAALIDQSLLRQEGVADSLARFRMLETVREFGRERLEACGEADDVRQQHAAFFLALTERAEPKLWTAEQQAWLERLEQELANIRAALAWSQTTGGAELALRIAAALERFWWRRGLFSEGRRWLEGLLDASSKSPAGRSSSLAPVRAQALRSAGWLAFCQGDLEQARTLLEESVALRRQSRLQEGTPICLIQLGLTLQYQGEYEQASTVCTEGVALAREQDSPSALAYALLNHGIVAYQQTDFALAARLSEESVALFRAVVDDPAGLAYALRVLGPAVGRRGDHVRAAALCEESLALFQVHGDRWGMAMASGDLARVSRMQGDLERAAGLYSQCLKLLRELGNRGHVARYLEALAEVIMVRQQAERAARLFGAAETIRAARSLPRPPVEQSDQERGVAAAQATLGQTAFAAAWAEGQAMSLDEAVSLALDEGQPS